MVKADLNRKPILPSKYELKSQMVKDERRKNSISYNANIMYKEEKDIIILKTKRKD